MQNKDNNIVLLLDIGTTTVSGALLDKSRKKILISGAVLNRQVEFGEDIISRIDFGINNPRGQKPLQTKGLESANELIKILSRKSNQKSSNIKKAVVVCNTAMHHMFLNLSLKPLITPPYRALQKSEVKVKAGTLGLDIFPDAEVTFLPNIGSFVGSDALSFIIAADIYKSKGLKLAIDIGTNGEIMLGSSSGIFVTSTAAGPAFEGRYISCGMPAVKGAIEKVGLNKNRINIKTIGNINPKGICGSGLIDATDVMLKTHAIDRTGKMLKKDPFYLYKGKGHSVYITQDDIRKMQLAKAAIYAGIKILMRRKDAQVKDLQAVVITGSFGNSINPKGAISIGLIPEVAPSKVKFIKDAALKGTEKYVLLKSVKDNITAIISKIHRIPMARKDFQQTFADSMAIQ